MAATFVLTRNFEFDPTLGHFERNTESFGPIFAERALTAGKGKFSLGITGLEARYDKFEGQSLDGSDLQLYLTHVDFNGDGTEDMLVQFIGGATHGTWGAQMKYILSRDEPDGVLRVINPENHICSVESYNPCDENYDYPEALKSTD